MFAANQGFNQVTQPSWSITPREVFDEIKTWRATANATIFTFSTTAPAATGVTAYRSLVPHPNGKLYGAPFNATGNILVIDTLGPTSTSSSSIVSFGLSGLGTAQKYATGCYAPTTGKIYYPPLATNNVLIIDPDTQTSQTQTWGLTFSGSDQYWTATLGTDNKIYCIGATTGNVLIIDPVANTASTTTFGGVWTSQAAGRVGAVRSCRNGKIYAAPYNSGSWLVIDTSTNPATAVTQNFGANNAAQSFQGCAQDSTGNIIAMGTNVTITDIIDPVANTRGRITSASNLQVLGPATGSDGRVYGLPFNNNTVGRVYDPVANTVNSIGGAGFGSFTWAVQANNRIYGIQDTTGANAQIRGFNTSGTGNLNPPLLNTISTSPGFVSGP